MPWGALSYVVFPKKTKCEEYVMRNECMLEMEYGSDLTRTVFFFGVKSRDKLILLKKL